MEDLLQDMRQLLESDVGALGSRPALGGINKCALRRSAAYLLSRSVLRLSFFALS